jgi:hypothetical protein
MGRRLPLPPLPLHALPAGDPMKPYHRNDNKLHEHEKFLAAGCPATGLWQMCRSWAADNWSDGFIPKYAARRFVDRGDRLAEYAARLVKVGLWEVADGGWQMHDYADWNTTVAERDAEREAAKTRMRRVRATPSNPVPTQSPPVAHPLPTQCPPVAPPETAGDEDLFGRTSQQRSRRTSRTGVTTSLQRILNPPTKPTWGPTRQESTRNARVGAGLELAEKYDTLENAMRGQVNDYQGERRPIAGADGGLR